MQLIVTSSGSIAPLWCTTAELNRALEQSVCLLITNQPGFPVSQGHTNHSVSVSAGETVYQPHQQWLGATDRKHDKTWERITFPPSILFLIQSVIFSSYSVCVCVRESVCESQTQTLAFAALRETSISAVEALRLIMSINSLMSNLVAQMQKKSFCERNTSAEPLSGVNNTCFTWISPCKKGCVKVHLAACMVFRLMLYYLCLFWNIKKPPISAAAFWLQMWCTHTDDSFISFFSDTRQK